MTRASSVNGLFISSLLNGSFLCFWCALAQEGQNFSVRGHSNMIVTLEARAAQRRSRAHNYHGRTGCGPAQRGTLPRSASHASRPRFPCHYFYCPASAVSQRQFPSFRQSAQKNAPNVRIKYVPFSLAFL